MEEDEIHIPTLKEQMEKERAWYQLIGDEVTEAEIEREARATIQGLLKEIQDRKEARFKRERRFKRHGAVFERDMEEAVVQFFKEDLGLHAIADPDGASYYDVIASDCDDRLDLVEMKLEGAWTKLGEQVVERHKILPDYIWIVHTNKVRLSTFEPEWVGTLHFTKAGVVVVREPGPCPWTVDMRRNGEEIWKMETFIRQRLIQTLAFDKAGINPWGRAKKPSLTCLTMRTKTLWGQPIPPPDIRPETYNEWVAASKKGKKRIAEAATKPRMEQPLEAFMGMENQP